MYILKSSNKQHVSFVPKLKMLSIVILNIGVCSRGMTIKIKAIMNP